MTILANMSIRTKLTTISMVACTFALILAGTAFMMYDHQHFKKHMVEGKGILAAAVGANCTAALAFDNDADAAETLFSLSHAGDIQGACIFRLDGTVLARYLPKQSLADVMPTQPSPEGHRFHQDHLDVFRPITLDGKQVGTAYLRVSLQPLDSRTVNQSIAVAIVIFGASLIVLIVVSLLQRLISRPIIALSTIASEISDSNDYSVRVPEHPYRDEVGVLVRQFNHMLSRIESKDSALQDARDTLETHVQERTRQLVLVNEQLTNEVSERSAAEQRVMKQLGEKEVLLKEIHHRVKNNLQVITSLLDLQARRIDQPTTRDIFKDSQTRVKSMALIHERLYRSTDLARIDLKAYVTDLVRYLLSTFSGRNRLIRVEDSVEPIELPVDYAVPCGLIVNELVCNSLKYAYPEGGEGVVSITARHEGPGEVRLEVSDDGVGFPEGFDPGSSETLGLRLVGQLVRQLGGTVEYESIGGTSTTVRFSTEKRELKGEMKPCAHTPC